MQMWKLGRVETPCVCLIFVPAEHVLKARVLTTLAEYKTPGDKGT